MLGQCFEKAELIARERQGLPEVADLTALIIHGNGLDWSRACLQRNRCDRVIVSIAIESPEHRPDTRGELARAEGFADVVVTTNLQADHPVQFR